MNENLFFSISVWGVFPFFGALREGRTARAWGWGAASFVPFAAGLLSAPASWGAACGALFAWTAAVLGPWVFAGVRRRGERFFRVQQRRLRRPAREASASLKAQRAALESLQGHLDRMQNRFALVQTMATQLDTLGILRSLGELWSGIPHVKKCLLLHRRPNGNWAPAFNHGVEKPEDWAVMLNEHPSLDRLRRTRRFVSLERFPELAALGVVPPLLVMPFVWGDDVMALGVVELDGSTPEEAWEGFQVEKKLVSIGLRRAFLYDLMSERSRHDGLTGALLRRPFLERVEEALRKHQRYGAAFALALVDLDRFKALNDRFGHLAGDRALLHLAQTVRRLSVPGVTLGRLGGDEFAFLLELSSFEMARAWVESFQEALRRNPPQEGGTDMPVTVSVGLAEPPAERIAVEDLLHRADRALYAAKEGGRDRVMVYAGPPREGS